MLGRVKLDGQKNRDTKLNHTITCRAMVCASGERLNREMANRLANRKAERFMTQAPQ